MQRILTRAQFQAVMDGGATVARTEHFVLHRAGFPPVPPPPPPESSTGPGPAKARALFAVTGQPWIGAILPKRWARRAVTRNTLKRQIYAVSLDFEDRLPAAAHVVRLRAGFDKSKFISATSDVLKVAVRAELQRLFAGSQGLIRAALIGLVKGYRFFLSPWLGSACRFSPTCSAYSLEALQRHGAAAGTYLTVARIARCHPWCAGGIDEVPAQVRAHVPALFTRFIPAPSPKKTP